MANSKEKTISIEYNRANDFKLVPATGAFGGPNGQSEIVCNFFTEFSKYPEGDKFIVDALTSKAELSPSQNTEAQTFIRELQVGVVMRPDIARSVGEWLIKTADKVIFQPPEKKQ